MGLSVFFLTTACEATIPHNKQVSLKNTYLEKMGWGMRLKLSQLLALSDWPTALPLPVGIPRPQSWFPTSVLPGPTGWTSLPHLVPTRSFFSIDIPRATLQHRVPPSSSCPCQYPSQAVPEGGRDQASPETLSPRLASTPLPFVSSAERICSVLCPRTGAQARAGEGCVHTRTDTRRGDHGGS